jgi:hypothetical protein
VQVIDQLAYRLDVEYRVVNLYPTSLLKLKCQLGHSHRINANHRQRIVHVRGTANDFGQVLDDLGLSVRYVFHGIRAEESSKVRYASNRISQVAVAGMSGRCFGALFRGNLPQAPPLLGGTIPTKGA